ncbi:hypothetical protein GCM10011506_16960 [Marivirga lumbricoides]|uniref:DUF115 domain-containing protein n=1 Tax=Marivirga lumbricoides TaxID=1046115 RepID=A0A2T4DMU9_9BACT|nr:hypothetical protein C9994_11535 [Marivirga lumbricoides]GGC32120.1 hypothetical protein GCM10011506_16960 [Marivirga lumbricoides]
MNIFKSPIQRVFENIFLTTFSILKMIILVRKRGKRITDLTHKKHFVILGNGPSLVDELKSINKIPNETEVICVNHFPSTDQFEIIKPKFYVTGAPDLWLDDIDVNFVENSNKLFNNIATKTKWDFNLFIPFEAKRYKRWQEPLKNNPHIKIQYYNNNAVEGIKSFNYLCYRKQLGMPRPHNVMIPCLSLCLQRHIQDILLLGVGHTWLRDLAVTKNNEVLLNQKHFYDKDKSDAKPLDKRGKGSRNLYEVLSKFTLAFYGYFVINDYANSLNVKIYNGTEDSFIDAFERKSIEDYIKTYKNE